MFELKTEIGRGLAANLKSSGMSPEAVERLIPVAAAGALGEAVRRRVQERGDLAGQSFPGWDALHEGDDGVMRGRRKFVSARYPDKASGRIVKSGAEMFDSSEVYHRANGTRPGTYSTTGGMWSGLSRVVWSVKRTDIMFRGRSPGQDPRMVNGKSRPLKVSNALKAWTVHAQHGVNLLAVTVEELARLTDGCMLSAAAGIANVLPVEWAGERPPSDVGGIFKGVMQVQRELPFGAAE